MQVDLGLTELDAQSAAQAFDADLAGKLRDYLQNDCILDLDGTNRVMDLLKKIYINGIRVLHAQFFFEPSELGELSADGQPSQEVRETMRARTEQLGKTISDNLVSAQHVMLYSVAANLAANDERVHRRPKH